MERVTDRALNGVPIYRNAEEKELPQNRRDILRRCCEYEELEEQGRLQKMPLKSDKADAENDAVNHPSHYTDGAIEVLDYIEDKRFNYHLGNVIKYVSRAGKKDDELEDLKKARFYLDRYISMSEESD